MTNTKHTPAPWYHDNGVVWHVVAVDNGYEEPEPAQEKIADTCPENGDLIAAAPELLEACEYLIEWFKKERDGLPNNIARGTDEGEKAFRLWWNEQLFLCDKAEETALAAIAKAKGE